jgi:hypothetical protein
MNDYNSDKSSNLILFDIFHLNFVELNSKVKRLQLQYEKL